MRTLLLVCLLTAPVLAQDKANPYNDPVPVKPPYYRVRYEASTKPGELIFPVTYTIWIPEGVKTLRGVVVHQHGCGVGSCRSGQTGAFDLHWQALAQKHDCALISPVYEQPADANCQMWCDPRNGSSDAFEKGLTDLAKQTGHPELATAPWAIWGHSGGGHWTGGMVLLHPQRVAAAWLRSGVPLLPGEERQNVNAYEKIDPAVLGVPMMVNLGTKEGFSDTQGRFAGNWPRAKTFSETLRGSDALVGVSVDPFTSHECGNQRYLAIPWFDACLTQRLPKEPGQPLVAIDSANGYLAPLPSPGSDIGEPVAAKKFAAAKKESIWLPTQAIATNWQQYMKDTNVADSTPPPAPTNVKLSGNTLTWQANADLESGIGSFTIVRDGESIATLPAKPNNRFGRTIFQGLQYSDTPDQPLVEMKFVDESARDGKKHEYRVIAENTVGLKSK